MLVYMRLDRRCILTCRTKLIQKGFGAACGAGVLAASLDAAGEDAIPVLTSTSWIAPAPQRIRLSNASLIGFAGAEAENTRHTAAASALIEGFMGRVRE